MTCVPQPSGRRCSSCSASLVSTRAASVAILRGDAPPRPETTSGPAAPSVVNSFQQPPSVHRQFIPRWFGELTVRRRHGDVRGEREMRMTPKHWLHLLLGRRGCAAGMSRLGKEVRGLLFPLPARSDVEGMTEVQLRSSQLQLRPLAVFPEVHYSAFKGNQWGDKLLWTAAPSFFHLLCCCMHACCFTRCL